MEWFSTAALLLSSVLPHTAHAAAPHGSILENEASGPDLKAHGRQPLAVMFGEDGWFAASHAGESQPSSGKGLLQLMDGGMGSAAAPGPAVDEEEMHLDYMGDEVCLSPLGVIDETPDLDRFGDALREYPNLITSLGSPEAMVTVLAVGDAALSAAVAGLAEDPNILESVAQILGGHIILGSFPSSALSDGQELVTLKGTILTVGISEGTVTFSTMDGGTVGTVTAADLTSCSGVVHVVSDVLIEGAPGSAAGVSAGADAAGEPAEAPTEATTVEPVEGCLGLLDYIGSKSDLTTFYNLIMSAPSIVEALEINPDAPLTVFAPNNFAFSAFELEILAENEDIAVNIIGEHFVVGTYSMASLTDGMVIPTLTSDELTVEATAGVVQLYTENDGTSATIIRPDRQSCHAIVHVINNMLVHG